MQVEGGAEELVRTAEELDLGKKVATGFNLFKSLCESKGLSPKDLIDTDKRGNICYNDEKIAKVGRAADGVIVGIQEGWDAVISSDMQMSDFIAQVNAARRPERH